MMTAIWLLLVGFLSAEGLSVLSPESSATEFVSDTDDITTSSSVSAGTPSKPSKIISLAAVKRNPSSMEPKAPPRAAALLQSGSFTAGSIKDSNGNVINVVRPSLPNDPEAKKIQAGVAHPTSPEHAEKASRNATDSAIAAVSESLESSVEAQLKSLATANLKKLTGRTSKMPQVVGLVQFEKDKMPDANMALAAAAPPFWDWMPFTRETADETPDRPTRSKQEEKDQKELDARTARVALKNKVEDLEKAAEIEEGKERAKQNEHRLKVLDNRYGTSGDNADAPPTKVVSAMEEKAAKNNAQSDAQGTNEAPNQPKKIEETSDQQQKASPKVIAEAPPKADEAPPKAATAEAPPKVDTVKASKIGEIEPAVAAAASSLATKTTFDLESYGKEAYEAINRRRSQLALYVKKKMEREKTDKKKHLENLEKAAVIATEMRAQRIHDDMHSRKEIAAALKNKQPI